jgi:hypothetical protein
VRRMHYQPKAHTGYALTIWELHGEYYAAINPVREIGREMSVLCRQFMPDFELRFSSNDTCPVVVYRDIVINSSPRGGLLDSPPCLIPYHPPPLHEREGGGGACN